ELLVGGEFDAATGVEAIRIASWDGVSWRPLGGGLGYAPVHALAELPGGAIVAGGGFQTAGEHVSVASALWDCPPVFCYADCDGSGSLDFFDFLCFQDRFAAAAPLADCDGSASLDLFDFLCFQNAFAAGCP